ncbi:hypothetical protein [Pseudoxanthomonas dokdonensis]|uniref:Membrane protein n=1 Tax=Pseudoxanthomonas dokdonensis TaxID=344882 RepID=A0A0R0CZD5_9GAMM|nr:hypothetical protein [Pseudoxanthomonas dokdonensis]KRG70504.1 membrane protein [Pseudoxanthomonas dokdonensis]
MIDLIGWTASAILLATLIRQIITQSRSAQANGVSHWLFIGQASASVLFVVYSVLLENWVFTVTNSCLLLTAIAGQWLTRHRRTAGADPAREGGTTAG